MANFGMIKSFNIDHGELDEISRPQCFVLGYELAQIDQLLAGPDAISRTVNAYNQQRIEAACRESGREFRLKWMEADESETWLLLEVAPR